MWMPRILLLFLTVAGLHAQEPLAPRAFLPDEYRSEVVLDLDAMRDAELLEALQRSPFALLLESFEEKFGFPLEDVNRMHAVLIRPDEQRAQIEYLWTFTGGESVGLPPEVEGQRVAADVGGRSVLIETPPGYGHETIHYSPAKGTLVFGTGHRVRPSLEGERTGGVPAPDLLSLTASPGTLAHVAFGLNDAMRAEMPPFMTDWNVAEDPLQYMVLRLRRTGADDEPHFVLEGVLRCSGGDAGPALIEAKARAGLKTLESHPRLGVLKRYWSSVEVERRGTDIELRLDLGDARSAAVALPRVLTPMMVPGGTAAEAQAEGEPEQFVEPQSEADDDDPK